MYSHPLGLVEGNTYINGTLSKRYLEVIKITSSYVEALQSHELFPYSLIPSGTYLLLPTNNTSSG